MHMAKDSEPSARKSVPAMPADDARATKELEQLFAGGAAPASTPRNADDFISQTARTKVAIVVPLFGYWNDIKDGFLDEEVLDASLERARSYAHNAYVIILAEPQRLPASAAKVINSKFVAGNARGIAMPNGSTYGDYLRKGMQVALTETDAQFFVFINPWVVIQEHGVDTLIDRINVPDNAPVICGYDVHEKLMKESGDDLNRAGEQFLKYKANAPYELKMLTFNFFGVNRYIAEMCALDPEIKTQTYLERDFFQNVAMKGYSAVSSERVPIFSFSFDWRQYVPLEDFESDKAHFLSKWSFLPDDVRYE